MIVTGDLVEERYVVGVCFFDCVWSEMMSCDALLAFRLISWFGVVCEWRVVSFFCSLVYVVFNGYDFMCFVL